MIGMVFGLSWIICGTGLVIWGLEVAHHGLGIAGGGALMLIVAATSRQEDKCPPSTTHSEPCMTRAPRG